MLTPEIQQDAGLGFSMATNGTLIAVGAPSRNSALGPETGAVFLYDAATGAFLHMLEPDLPVAQRRFGTSVVFAGNTLVVGAAGDDTDAPERGRVFVFDAASLEQIDEIAPTVGVFYTGFGRSIAADGTTVAIAATGLTDSDTRGIVFVYDMETLTLVRTINPINSEATRGFGHSLALRDGKLAVGAARHTADGNVTDAGAVFIYDIESGALLSTLHSPDVQEHAAFGTAVAIADGRLLVGEPGWHAPGTTGADGTVRMFDMQTLGLTGSIIDHSAQTGAGLGRTLASGRDIIAVTSRTTVRLYDARSGGHVVSIRPSSAVGPDGWPPASIVMHGSRIFAGAPGDQEQGPNAGAAYLYDLDDLCLADLVIPFDGPSITDIQRYLSWYLDGSPEADIAEPFGSLDFFDIVEFIRRYNHGCP